MFLPPLSCYISRISFVIFFIATTEAAPFHDLCYPSPCGPNAQCKDGICSCLAEYNGDPYRGCRPECVMNSECAPQLACIKNKCRDPCPGLCGQNADCNVYNHIPVCTCPSGMAGNAFTQCSPVEIVHINPCSPSPCGPNSRCREYNGQAVCSCLEGFLGTPPSCRPECTGSSDCDLNEACSNQKCIDPCPGTCGINAKCQVINHNPICSCAPGYTGEPFTRCHPIRKLKLFMTDFPPPPRPPFLQFKLTLILNYFFHCTSPHNIYI